MAAPVCVSGATADVQPVLVGMPGSTAMVISQKAQKQTVKLD